MKLFAVVCLLAFILGTAGAAEPDLTRRQSGDLAIQSRAILGKYCGACHKDGSALSSLSVLDHKQLVGLQSPVPFAAKSGLRSQILEFLDDGSMPPAGHERPTPAEVDILKRWIAAKAPSYPQAFDPATTQRVLLDDFAQVAEKDRPFVRYLSMAHLVPAGTEAPSLKAAELNLQKAITATTETASAPPVPVDDSATLFKLDIRSLGWAAPDLFQKIVEQSPEGVFPMNAFDLILLEYPDAAPLTGPDGARMNQALSEMKQLRPIPYLRADWFAEALLNKGAHTPLAEELKGLIRLGNYKGKPKPDGQLNEDFGARKSVRAAVPPLAAFYPKDVAATAPPFPKLALEVIDPKGDTIAQVETEEPFRLKLTANADGYFLTTSQMKWFWDRYCPDLEHRNAAIAAVIFYLLTYAVMNLGAFAVVQLIARGGDRRTEVEDYNGIGFQAPWLAFCLSLFLLSLLGMPLTAGFIGKVMVFRAALDQGYYVLVVIGVLNTAVSAYYYLRLIIVMFFRERTSAWNAPRIPASIGLALVITILGVLYLGLFPGRVINALQTKPVVSVSMR